MAIQEYTSALIPAFVTLGSLGILYPLFVEGVILISFVLFVLLFLIGKLLNNFHLKGYFDILMAAISVILAFTYFEKFSTIFLLTGAEILIFAIFSVYVATQEIQWAS